MFKVTVTIFIKIWRQNSENIPDFTVHSADSPIRNSLSFLVADAIDRQTRCITECFWDTFERGLVSLKYLNGE